MQTVDRIVEVLEEAGIDHVFGIVTGAITLTMPEWGIGVAEQDQTGIGRQAAPIEIEVDGFGPGWDQTQRGQLKWGGHLGWHRIDIGDRVCFGGINVHAGSLL
jgi:hypothetical protein